MRRHIALLLPLFLLGVAVAVGQNLLLKNAQIVDPASRTIVRGALVIRDGVIRDVLRSVPSKFDGQILDLNGKWVIPGLMDMHVHSFGNSAPQFQLDIFGTEEAARRMLYCGVTGFLDLFMQEDQIFAARDKQRSEGLLAADIYCAGPILTCKDGHGTEFGIPTRLINSPAEADSVIDDLVKRKPDVIKIVYDHAAYWMPTIDRATMEAAVRRAGKHGLKSVIHIGTWQDAREAIEAGAECITHIHGNEDIPADLAALMKKKGIYVTPTMAVETDLPHIAADNVILDNPMLRAVASASTIDAYRGDTSAYDKRTKNWLRTLIRIQPSVYRSVRLLNQTGVTLLAGTDVGNLGTFQGFSLHRELELLVEAGLSNWDALAAATTKAGEFLGVKIGMRPGDVANLVVLDASPVERIANTQKIAMVIHHGAVVDRDSLLIPVAVPAAAWTSVVLDDFSKNVVTVSRFVRRTLENDSVMGGSSTMSTTLADGALQVRGRLVPRNGIPAFAGITLTMGDANSPPFDVTSFKGIRIRIKPAAGPILLRLVTSTVKNYDYHGKVIENSKEWATLDIPFSEFTQLWSQPVPWTGKDFRGVQLWASGVFPGDYDFSVDSIEFY
jgi:imidazolonepropionase-like amidohydrolase